jgi:cell division transport system permease protein
MLISFFRVVHFAVQDIIRNLSLSFMTVLILVLMLLSVNTLFGIQVLTDESLSMVRDQIDVSVYFQEGADEERIEEVQTYVASFPEVTEIEYLTPEMVEEQFREKHAANNEHIMEALDVLGENPFGALMIVKTREPADYQKVIEALNIPEYEYLI